MLGLKLNHVGKRGHWCLCHSGARVLCTGKQNYIWRHAKRRCTRSLPVSHTAQVERLRNAGVTQGLCHQVSLFEKPLLPTIPPTPGWYRSHWNHFVEMFATGCTGSCHSDNTRCDQWRNIRQNDISVSVSRHVCNFLKQQGKSEKFDSCDQPSNFA